MHHLRWWRVIGCVVVGWAIAVLLQISPPLEAQSLLPPDAASPPTELRGVWLTNIDSDVLFSRRSLRRALRRLHHLHFNTVYPTVWNWGYTLYPSAIAQGVTGIAIDPHPGLQDRDMLQEIVTRGHELNMSVIPWFEFGFMAPADSALAQRHPDWITQRYDGNPVVMEGVHPRVWLNPLHPDVQQMILDFGAELASRYAIDGIQLDDHFGMPVELGYDPYTVQLYQQEHQGRLPPEDPHDPLWMRWRADKISEVMIRLFHTVKAIRPDCILALSPNPREFSYDFYLQDWWRWEREGYVEELIIQIYRDDMERFLYELNQPEIAEVRHHIPLGVGILAGLRNRPVAMEQITEQVKTVRDFQLAGVSFFFYETLGDRDDQFRLLFPTPALRPTLETFKTPDDR